MKVESRKATREAVMIVYSSTNNKQKHDLYERAVAYILNLPKTEKQVRQWYARKTNDQELIDADVARLIESNLINDAEYARMYVEAKKGKMGIGMMRNKLYVNGIAPALINDALATVECQYDLALSLVHKYMRSKDKTTENKSKLFRWLMGKGFASDLATEVINEYWH